VICVWNPVQSNNDFLHFIFISMSDAEKGRHAGNNTTDNEGVFEKTHKEIS
jgi:hypothetical protein